MGLLNLTESERLEILNLHNNARIIKELASPVVSSATPAAPMDDKSKIMAIQTLLKKKNFDLGTSGPNGDGIDGILGPKTLGVLSTIMKSKPVPPAATTAPAAPAATTAPAAPAATTAPAAPAATTPVAATATTTTAPAATTGTASPVTPAAPQSNRDLRRDRQDLRRANKREMQDLRAQQRAQQ
jgi:hypothetical protein